MKPNELREALKNIRFRIEDNNGDWWGELLQDETIDAVLDAVIAALPTNAEIPELTSDQLDGFTKAVFDMRNKLQSAKSNTKEQ